MNDIEVDIMIYEYEKSKIYEIDHVSKYNVIIETGLCIGDLIRLDFGEQGYEKSKIYEIDHVSKYNVMIETGLCIGEISIANIIIERYER